MKMPEKIVPAMFAPCGMNCMVAWRDAYFCGFLRHSEVVETDDRIQTEGEDQRGLF